MNKRTPSQFTQLAGMCGALILLCSCTAPGASPTSVTTVTSAIGSPTAAASSAVPSPSTGPDEAARLAQEQAAERSAQEQSAAAAQASASEAAAQAAADQAAANQAAEQSAADQAAAEQVTTADASDADTEQADADNQLSNNDSEASGINDGSDAGGWYDGTYGQWISPDTADRAAAAGIDRGGAVPDYLRCGSICGEQPTSGEVQAWNLGLYPPPPGYEEWLDDSDSQQP